MIKSRPEASTTVQRMFTHMLSFMPRKMMPPTSSTSPMAINLIGSAMPAAVSRFSAMAWTPVAMLVRPLIMTAKPTT